MGLRDRLKERIKGALGQKSEGSPASAPVVVPAAPVSASAPPMAELRPKPTTNASNPVAVAKAPPAPVLAVPPAAVLEKPRPPATPEAPPPSASPPAATETARPTASPPAARDATLPPAAPTVAPRVTELPKEQPSTSATALRFVADSADAPVRNTHIAKPRDTTGAGFTIHLHNSDEKFDLTLTAEPGEYLLDAVERLGAVLPYSCRNGGCLSCTGMLISGTYEMGEQYTLEEEQIARGYFLLCCSHATSNMDIRTHMADEVG